MFTFFKKTKALPPLPLLTDIHSHLLAGIDDGVKTLEDAEEIINRFQDMGYKRLITTPHIMSHAYQNDPKVIELRLTELKDHLVKKNIQIEIHAAAEYYLDETVYSKILDKQPLLTFGKHYLLFETNFLSEPFQLKEFIFQATAQGYQLVLAHPERYHYMSLEKAEDLRNRGVLFQINTLSLTGYYSKPIQNMAQQLINKGWIDFLGSDCHNSLQATVLQSAMSSKYVEKALALPLLNNTL